MGHDSARFAYDDTAHEYVDLEGGEVVPHVTSLLAAGGWIDDRWYTEESCVRGAAVHRLTADYDLGVIADPAMITSRYKGWLLGHIAAMRVIQPIWTQIEEPMVSRRDHFGGRPDRAGMIYGAQAVMEIKSGPPPRPARPSGSVAAHDATSHQIQTALQSLLVASALRLPPESIGRFALYLKANGKFRFEQFVCRSDVAEARRLVQQYCAVPR